MENSNVYVIDGEADRWRGEGTGERGGKNGAGNGAKGKVGSRARAGAHGGLPRLAASCSMLVSGSGHFVHRRWKTGAFYLVALCLAIGLHVVLATSWPRVTAMAGRYGLGEIDLLFGLLMIDLFVIAVLLAGVYTAFALGSAYAGGLEDPTPHPAWPALASLLVPGWGQIINGQAPKALAFLAATYAGVLGVAAWWTIPEPIGRLLSGLREPLQPVLIVSGLVALGLIVWALSLYDAVLVARYRRRSPARRGASPSGSRRGPAARRSAPSKSGRMAVTAPVGTPRRRSAG